MSAIHKNILGAEEMDYVVTLHSAHGEDSLDQNSKEYAQLRANFIDAFKSAALDIQAIFHETENGPVLLVETDKDIADEMLALPNVIAVEPADTGTDFLAYSHG